MAIPKRIADRIASGLKNFGPVLTAQKDRDVSEADTVTIIKDLLSDIFGYDKYAELTSEHSIRGTFCDLAVNPVEWADTTIRLTTVRDRSRIGSSASRVTRTPWVLRS